MNYLTKIIILVFIFSACTPKQPMPAHAVIFHRPTDSKLTQRVINLQKKLNNAQKTLSEDQQDIERLRAQLGEAKLNSIESQIVFFEKKWRNEPQRLIQSTRREISSLMLDEREQLSHMIQEGTNEARAQMLLDRILQLITQLSDSAAISG